MPLQNEMIIVLIASVMLAMGLALKPIDFVHALRRPLPLLLILLVNTLVLPLVGWGLGAQLSSAMALALLLAGACGVGSTAPLFTANVRGDIALTTTAVVVSGFVCLLTLPLTLALAGVSLPASEAVSAQVSIQTIAEQAFLTMLVWQVLPLLLGMWVHHLNPLLAKRWAKRFKTLGNVALGLLMVGFMLFKGHLFLTVPLPELGVMAALVAATYVLPLALVRYRWGTSLLFSSCTRNLNLALLLASQVLASDELVLAILCYATLMYCLLVPFTLLLRKQESRWEATV